jgi:hypothetical protein
MTRGTGVRCGAPARREPGGRISSPCPAGDYFWRRQRPRNFSALQPTKPLFTIVRSPATSRTTYPQRGRPVASGLHDGVLADGPGRVGRFRPARPRLVEGGGSAPGPHAPAVEMTIAGAGAAAGEGPGLRPGGGGMVRRWRWAADGNCSGQDRRRRPRGASPRGVPAKGKRRSAAVPRDPSPSIPIGYDGLGDRREGCSRLDFRGTCGTRGTIDPHPHRSIFIPRNSKLSQRTRRTRRPIGPGSPCPQCPP